MSGLLVLLICFLGPVVHVGFSCAACCRVVCRCLGCRRPEYQVVFQLGILPDISLHLRRHRLEFRKHLIGDHLHRHVIEGCQNFLPLRIGPFFGVFVGHCRHSRKFHIRFEIVCLFLVCQGGVDLSHLLRSHAEGIGEVIIIDQRDRHEGHRVGIKCRHLRDPVIPFVLVAAVHHVDVLAGACGHQIIGISRQEAGSIIVDRRIDIVVAQGGHCRRICAHGNGSLLHMLGIIVFRIRLDDILFRNGHQLIQVLCPGQFHQLLCFSGTFLLIGSRHAVLGVIRHAQGKAAALGDDALEELALLDLFIGGGGQDGDISRAGGVAEDGHVIRVAAKGCHVLLDPFQSPDVIQQGQVLGIPEVLMLILLAFRDRGQVCGAEDAQSVVDRDHDHVLILAEIVQLIGVVGGGAHQETAAVEPDHDRFFLVRIHVPGPDVQGQAVFTDGILASIKDPADALFSFCQIRQGIVGLNGRMSELIRHEYSGALIRRLGRLPSQVSCGGFRVGDALEGEHAVAALDTDELAVGAGRCHAFLRCQQGGLRRGGCLAVDLFLSFFLKGLHGEGIGSRLQARHTVFLYLRFHGLHRRGARFTCQIDGIALGLLDLAPGDLHRILGRGDCSYLGGGFQFGCRMGLVSAQSGHGRQRDHGRRHCQDHHRQHELLRPCHQNHSFLLLPLFSSFSFSFDFLCLLIIRLIIAIF